MNLRHDSFLRCYLEAWLYWIVLIAIAGIAFWLVSKVGNFPGLPTPGTLLLLADPLILLGQAIIIVPLLAALLVGRRREFVDCG